MQHLVIAGAGVFLNVFHSQQCPSNQAIAGDDDDEGHQETQQTFQDTNSQKKLFQPLAVFGFGVQDATHGGLGVFDVMDVPGEGCWHTQDEGKKPDHYTGDACVHHGAKPPWLHWVHNGKVPVSTESSEEEDAGVQVKSDQSCTGLAQEPSKGPAVLCGGERCPHGQSDEEREVWDGEIEDKNVGHRFEFHVEVDDSHHHGVTDDADDKVEAVDDGHQGEDEFVASRHATCQVYLLCRPRRLILHFSSF